MTSNSLTVGFPWHAMEIVVIAFFQPQVCINATGHIPEQKLAKPLLKLH